MRPRCDSYITMRFLLVLHSRNDLCFGSLWRILACSQSDPSRVPDYPCSRKQDQPPNSPLHGATLAPPTPLMKASARPQSTMNFRCKMPTVCHSKQRSSYYTYVWVPRQADSRTQESPGDRSARLHPPAPEAATAVRSRSLGPAKYTRSRSNQGIETYALHNPQNSIIIKMRRPASKLVGLSASLLV